jgi:hypothetical protein
MPTEGSAKKACCLVSEILEECGIDRKKVRQVKRQVLEGVVLFCQWQLERMESSQRPEGKKKARKVEVD